MVHILFTADKEGDNLATQFFQSQRAGKRNREWRNTRKVSYLSSNWRSQLDNTVISGDILLHLHHVQVWLDIELVIDTIFFICSLIIPSRLSVIVSLIFRHLGFWSLSCRPTVSHLQVSLASQHSDHFSRSDILLFITLGPPYAHDKNCVIWRESHVY